MGSVVVDYLRTSVANYPGFAWVSRLELFGLVVSSEPALFHILAREPTFTGAVDSFGVDTFSSNQSSARLSTYHFVRSQESVDSSDAARCSNSSLSISV